MFAIASKVFWSTLGFKKSVADLGKGYFRPARDPRQRVGVKERKGSQEERMLRHKHVKERIQDQEMLRERGAKRKRCPRQTGSSESNQCEKENGGIEKVVKRKTGEEEKRVSTKGVLRNR